MQTSVTLVVECVKHDFTLVAATASGQEPGELNRAYSIGIRADGKLLVHAGGNARINVFPSDGELLQDWP